MDSLAVCARHHTRQLRCGRQHNAEQARGVSYLVDLFVGEHLGSLQFGGHHIDLLLDLSDVSDDLGDLHLLLPQLFDDVHDAVRVSVWRGDG